MNRRKFLRIAGITAAISAIPVAARTVDVAEGPAASYGGPTPNGQFYVTSSGGTPKIDANTWTLKIHGLVRNPIALTYDDLKRMPAVKQTLTLECISNPPGGSAIGNAEWVGVKLKPILDRAGLKSSAVYAAIRGADGYYTGVPADEIVREENFLPYLMNGVPLPPVHGYPVRIFIPGKYGQKQPKWITEIEFVDRPFIGFWEARGWSNEAWRKVNSGFFYPRPNGGILDILSLSSAARVTGPVEIIGWALAGPAGVKRVDVSTDDGATWHRAELIENNSPYEWTIWKYRLAPAKPTEFTIRARATDGDGHTQPDRDPDKYAGLGGQPRMKVAVTPA
jgi:DMSO/TMAO reductase YedYZ molybdopterin-dependent catalytic subunit